MATNYPSNFTALNSSQSKNLNIVLAIDGLAVTFSLQQTYKRVAYGDPGITYGLPGLVYGGLYIDQSSYPYISSESSLSIQQRLEPEQGRASISQLSIVLIDKDGYVSKLVSPGGGVLTEILGQSVKIYVGYQNSGYPGDYYVAYQGIITTVTTQAGRITLGFGDANQKRRQAAFKLAKASLQTAITGSPTTIYTDTTNFYQIGNTGIDPLDLNVKCYLKIDNEVIQYGRIPFSGQVTNLTRGSRGTVSADHAAGVDILNTIQIEGHPLTIALKIMLSGWNGPYLSGQTFQALGTNGTSSLANAILIDSTKDAVLDYGLSVGDFVTVTRPDSTFTTYTITAIESGQGLQNRVLRTDLPTAYVAAATGYTLAFRSQFDTLPVLAGLKMSPQDIDVAAHISIRDTYLIDASYYMQVYIQSQQTGKEFIEQQLFLPIGCYSLTRFGKLSVNITKTPIASSTLVFLTPDNIIDAEQITQTRSMNNRKFFNQIQYNYDQDDSGKYTSVYRALDTDSLNQIGILNLLPISSNGLKSSFGASALISSVSTKLLNRYRRAASEIKLKVNFGTGAQIEVGDVVALKDNGNLKITNFANGSRNIGITLYEVIDKTTDIKSGLVTLGLISGEFGSAADRFGTISPSSVVTTGSSTTSVRVLASYGASLEQSKWQDYIGQPVVVRDPDWTTVTQVTLTGIDTATTPIALTVSPALASPPAAGYIVDIPTYPDTTIAAQNAAYKAIHAFMDPSVACLAGGSTQSFKVSLTDITKFVVGAVLLIRDTTWSAISPEVSVVAVNATTGTVTVSASLGFSPGSGYYAEIVGFKDGGAGYRVYS
jgi:hypothetical protein